MIHKMARKRDVPFVTGRIEIWAAAVIHALGTVNFLFDKASQPAILDEFFLQEQSKRLKQRTYRDYEDVISLFQDYLNHYFLNY